MFETIKSKSHMISKLFVFQIAMSLFGLFVVSPFNGYWQVAASAFSCLFYFSLVSYAIIEDGQKDCISHTAGRIEGKSYTGFVYALVSYIPTLVVVIIEVILRLCTAGNTLTTLKDLLGLLIRFGFMGMYLGFDSGLVQRAPDPETLQMNIIKGSDALVFMSDNYLIFAICLVFLPFVAGLCYNLAFKGLVHVDTSVKNKPLKNKNEK